MEDRSMWINATTIGDRLDQEADRNDGIALVMGDRRLTYRELSDASDRVAAGLLGLGVRRGDRVGILMPNSVDFVVGIFAIAKIAAVIVPINARFKAHEASYVIDHAEISVMLTSGDPSGATDFPALLAQVISEGGMADATVVDLGESPRAGFLTRDDLLAAAVPVPDVKKVQATVRLRDIGILMYTSGTTARPKGCLLTHEAVVRQGEKVARTRFNLTREDALWDPLPLFHCGGIVPMLGVFSVGAKFCHPGFFEPGPSLRMIKAERCTVLYPAFEAIWLGLVDHEEYVPEELQHVRLVQNIHTPERMEQFAAQMPWASHVTSYGSTESATNLTMGLEHDTPELRLRTLGPVVDGMEVKIVDPETGLEVPPGVMGELCFRGYSCFEGYYKDPELTAQVFDADGFFHSGDRASIAETGHMIYGGRIKDMLKVGGENVAAIEIEDFLATHPAVRVVQVVGVPDARYDEVPAAFVELEPGASATEADIVGHCLGRVATYKVPRYVRFVTSWPMSGTKIKKFELRDPLVAELTAEGVPQAPKPVLS
ncbi:AMP-binding protein [Aeromicrobium sp. SMF47]|nr:AMP-binding protein [Aeromicrobium yanjiei]MRK02818.1 AMP-binding protein [Aeromicrobium sp. S22]